MTWTKNGNGNWDNSVGKQLGVPDTFYKITIEKISSKFGEKKSKFVVVAYGTNSRGHSVDFALQYFNTQEKAQDFAAKLAVLLNEQEE